MFIKTTPMGNVKFTADNGFDPVFIGLLIKIDCSKHIAMIGHSNGRHLIFFSFFKKILNADGSIEQAILSMNMKMNKIGVLHIGILS